MHKTLDPLAPLRQLIATRLASIDANFAPREDGSLPYPDGDSDGAHVLLRQHAMLIDLQEAIAIGVRELDLAFEGEFDPVEASLMQPQETAYERKKALHEIALAGIEPIIAAARAAGISIHAPELEQEVEAGEEGPEGERFAG
jgi:hypothetical protein